MIIVLDGYDPPAWGHCICNMLRQVWGRIVLVVLIIVRIVRINAVQNSRWIVLLFVGGIVAEHVAGRIVGFLFGMILPMAAALVFASALGWFRHTCFQ